MSLFFVLTATIVSVYGQFPNCNGGYDQISHLPDYHGPALTQYSGYIEVNRSANGSLFYWFIQSQQSAKAPVLVWLNGGPGASSMTGLFSENGPFRVDSGGKSLSYNTYSWSKYYNMLFVDNPINTGFSFCDPGQEVTNEQQMAQNFHTFLQGFFQCHKSFRSNPFYITGESYAGRYIPFIWKYSYESFNINGLAIGNGIYDPFIQFYSSPFYAFTNGIIDYEQYVSVNQTVSKCLSDAKEAAETMNITALNNSANECLYVTNNVYGDLGGHIFQYDIRENDEHIFDSITNDIATYLGQEHVAREIHTCSSNGCIPWKSSDGTSSYNPVAAALNYDIVLNNSALFIPQALANGTRILFYNGQFDGSVCNNYGNQQCLNQLNYKGEWMKLDRKPYYLHNLTVGYKKVSNDAMLTYFVVADSGHLVPYNQPEPILDFIHHWIENDNI